MDIARRGNRLLVVLAFCIGPNTRRSYWEELDQFARTKARRPVSGWSTVATSRPWMYVLQPYLKTLWWPYMLYDTSQGLGAAWLTVWFMPRLCGSIVINMCKLGMKYSSYPPTAYRVVYMRWVVGWRGHPYVTITPARRASSGSQDNFLSDCFAARLSRVMQSL